MNRRLQLTYMKKLANELDKMDLEKLYKIAYGDEEWEEK